MDRPEAYRSTSDIIASRVAALIGESLLWFEVLFRAYEDALGVHLVNGDDCEELKAEIREWLDTPDFRDVCSYAGADPEAIKEVFEEMLRYGR